MRMKQKQVMIGLFLFGCGACFSIDPEVNPRITARVSDRIVVFSEPVFNSNQIVINSNQGLVLIDTGFSPAYASKLRVAAQTEFGEKEFVYVINTHHHWDHIQGNQLFPEATIVAHENCSAAMIKQAARMSIPEMPGRPMLEGVRPSDGRLPPPPPSHILIDGADNFSVTPPSISFSDRMTIRVGELTLDLIYYGAGHTNNDILVYIREEQVLAVGDLFYKNSLPQIGGQVEPDVQRWLLVLKRMLEAEPTICHVVPGHNELFDHDEFVAYYRYINDLWHGILEQVEKQKTLPEILAQFDLQRWPTLSAKNMKSNREGSLHDGNVKAMWQYVVKGKGDK